uniref:Putative ovule protein n=1 Tax=Solanum chacoense TaxID=4108 RepID=A0A0V0HRI8_SOLCH
MKFLLLLLFISKGCWFFWSINGEITGNAEMGNHPLQKIPFSDASFFRAEISLEIRNGFSYPNGLLRGKAA